MHTREEMHRHADMIEREGYPHAATLLRDAADEIERLKIHYGVVAHPERVWQGACGHLWRHDGGEPKCPHCAAPKRSDYEITTALWSREGDGA